MTQPVFFFFFLNIPNGENVSGSAWCKWWCETCHHVIKSADLCLKGCWMMMPLLHTVSAFLWKRKCLINDEFQMLSIHMWRVEDKSLKEEQGVRFPIMRTHNSRRGGWTLYGKQGSFLFFCCHRNLPLVAKNRQGSLSNWSSRAIIYLLSDKINWGKKHECQRPVRL